MTLSTRILIADDEPQMLASYRDCFAIGPASNDELAALGADLFAGGNEAPTAADFSNICFDYVSQGEHAVAKVADAINEGDPYAVLFLDMRMPPGIDGYETATRVRQLDKNINIVVVTGYSDHSPMGIAKVAGPIDRLFYVTKPFKTSDIQQLAQSLAARWNHDIALRAAHQEVENKLTVIEKVNVQLAASEARCRHISLHDHLTRLPNRTHFGDFTENLLLRGKGPVSVLLLDLDHFKNVNDTMGHAAGDELMRQLADRLRSETPEGALLARLGGDEFALAVEGITEAAAQKLANQLVKVCAKEFEIMSTRVFVGASVGIATNTTESIGVSQMLRCADLALYAAKNAGRNTWRLFAPEMDESAQTRSHIERRLREALKTDNLRLVYQPVIDLVGGSALGYEALLRWTDDELGDVPPALFVPVAEQCGLASTLGEWVIRNAVAECATWSTGYVSINISPHHFQSRDLISCVMREAASHDLPLNRLQFEITETAMFTNPLHAAEVITQLRSVGIRIALDDFGTGYSSLVNLRDFELDCIKIDKSFIETLGEDRQASAIITSVTAMARMLGLNVVAEGVETAAQVQALRLLGCGMMQGFYYSLPLASAEMPYHHVSDEVVDSEPLPGDAKPLAA